MRDDDDAYSLRPTRSNALSACYLLDIPFRRLFIYYGLRASFVHILALFLRSSRSRGEYGDGLFMCLQISTI